MRPTEILDEYSDTDAKIIDHLESKGYELLGQGVDQTAFLEPGGKTVLKIFGTQNNVAMAPTGKQVKPKFSPDQKMFFIWAEYCNSHRDNPFLPKFSGFESFYWDGHVYLQIRQEILQPLSRTIAVLSEEFNDFIAQGYSFKDAVQELEDYDPDELDTLVRATGSMQSLKLFYRTIKEIDAIANKRGWTNDLHADNFMSRGKNFPVIVDPWVV